MTKQSKTSSESKPQCKWCDKAFSSERTLASHMCVKKRRWADRDMTHIRLAFRVFQMFYDMNTATAKPKTMEDFIRSSYYEGFAKFGRSCIRNEYLQPEAFAEWLIRNAVKLTDWCKDATYDKFLLEYVKKETGLRALERSIIYLDRWSEESGIAWQDYFREVSTPRAVYDIRSCKISPWLIYLSDSGADLLTRMSDEQVKMIDDIINANFWMSVFQKNSEEVDAVQSACKAAGI